MDLTVSSNTLLITQKQFSFIRDLAADRDWHPQAPAKISLTIKIVTRHTGPVTDLKVSRTDASAAISYMLGPNSPKKKSTQISAPVSTQSISPWVELKKVLADVPASKYAIPTNPADPDGGCAFLEVVQRKNGAVFINHLQGAPGDWKRIFLPVAAQVGLAETIAENPTKYAVLYCERFTRCAACDSPLSNAKSIAEAMGPVCRKKFKW